MRDLDQLVTEMARALTEVARELTGDDNANPRDWDLAGLARDLRRERDAACGEERRVNHRAEVARVRAKVLDLLDSLDEVQP